MEQGICANVIPEIQENMCQLDKNDNCGPCYIASDLKKLGKSCLKIGLFIANVFVAYFLINDVYQYFTQRPINIEFRDIVLFYLIIELALKSEGIHSFFDENPKSLQSKKCDKEKETITSAMISA